MHSLITLLEGTHTSRCVAIYTVNEAEQRSVITAGHTSRRLANKVYNSRGKSWKGEPNVGLTLHGSLVFSRVALNQHMNCTEKRKTIPDPGSLGAAAWVWMLCVCLGVHSSPEHSHLLSPRV